jgi:chorismate mutase
MGQSPAVAGSMDSYRLYALRGAISVDDNTEPAILAGTRELVSEIMERNGLAPEQMVSCVFSATTDLNAQFPAVAARDLGLSRLPLLCTQEIDVPGALPRVIRVLLHYYAAPDHAPQHVYLREARALRTDLEAAQ